MAITINKVLQGASTQVLSAVYIYSLPNSIAPTQNAIANYNEEEIFINCDTTTGIQTLRLPLISLFGGGWCPKIYISNIGGGTVDVQVTSSEDENNDINGLNTITIASAQTGYFHIVTKQNYACWLTPSIIP
ncbi:MAG: hypothetical protein WCI04_00095 [archaeon]